MLRFKRIPAPRILFALLVVMADGRRKKMPRLTMVRYTVKPEAAEENIRLSRAVFTEAHQTKPEHIAYGLFRQGDEFIHIFLNLAEDSSEALTGMPSFQAFEQGMAERVLAPPAVTRLAVERIDSYGLPA
jgi:hypothetical protein